MVRRRRRPIVGRPITRITTTKKTPKGFRRRDINSIGVIFEGTGRNTFSQVQVIQNPFTKRFRVQRFKLLQIFPKLVGRNLSRRRALKVARKTARRISR